MPETDIQISGLDAYIDRFAKSPDKLIQRLREQALKDAETLAGKQRENCVVGVTGMLRESIQTFLEQEVNVITAGSRTNMDYAAYVEFGTGPEGSKKGHPLDAEFGIVRKSEGWVFYFPGVGFRYTRGRPAMPFMYPAMKDMEPIIKEHFGSAVQEVFK